MKRICINDPTEAQIVTILRFCRQNGFPALAMAHRMNIGRSVLSSRQSTQPVAEMAAMVMFGANRRICVREEDFTLIKIRFPEINI